MSRQRFWSSHPAVFTARACLLLAGVAAGGCNRQAPPAGFKPPPAAVTVAAAVARDVPVYLDEIGRCAPSELVNVQPQVSGKITKIHFVDGADVKAGEELFTIDPRPFQATLDEAASMSALNQASLELAKRDLARVEEAVRRAALSQQELDEKQTGVQKAEAQLNANQAMVAKSKLDVEYCTIRSPIDGRAGQRMVDVGNVVKANEAQLLTVQRLDPIYAEFTTAERNLPAVRRYMAEGTLKAQVRAQGETGQPLEGDLTFLDSSVKQGAGTVKLRATLSNADRRLWGGQFVDVRVVLKTQKDAILVPSQAVQIGQTGPYVYVVKPDSTADQRQVTPGQRQGDLVVVEGNVKAGEQIVTTGQMAVMPGMPVRVQPAAPMPPGAGPTAAAGPTAPTAGTPALPATAPAAVAPTASAATEGGAKR